MKALKAHFDGKVLIPDEPIDLPANCTVELVVRPCSDSEKPLVELLRALEDLPANGGWPADGAAQHDHYLYGAEKR